jgi:Na+-driven multidrug efflux pump
MWCLIWLIPVDGLQWVWRFAVQGAGDTRWPMLMVLGLAAVGLALPAWLMYPLLTEPRMGLIACYLLMAAYTTVLAGVMAWRYYRGPWAAMTVRR